MRNRIVHLTAAVALSVVVGACADQPTQPPAPSQPSITVSDADYALARTLPQLTPAQACDAFVGIVGRFVTAQEAAVLRAACLQFAGATTRPTVAQVCAALLAAPPAGLPAGRLRDKVARVCALLTAPRPPNGDDDDDDDDDK